MSHPLRDTIPAARCPECKHFARPDEVTQCRHCGCKHHVAPRSPYGGHDPQTPPGAEAALKAFLDALGPAAEALEAAANEEVDAQLALESAEREAMFSPDCPKVGVFDGVRVTVRQQELWIAGQVAPQREAYLLAKAKRQAAAKVLDVLRTQGSLQQSISRSVGDSYRGQREPGW